MTGTDVVWAVGRATIGTAVKLATPLRVYGAERMPADGGLVVAANHFSWLDPRRWERRARGRCTSWQRWRRTASRGSAS